MKYCDTCIYFVKRTLGCKLFGARPGAGKRVENLPVEYVRAVPFKMCGPEGTYHNSLGSPLGEQRVAAQVDMTHEEKREMDLRTARLQIHNYDDYFGFSEKDYITLDPHQEFDQDMEVERLVEKAKKAKKTKK